MNPLRNDISKVLISEEDLQSKVRQLAARISADYAGKGDLMLVGVLKGSVVFFADLFKHIELPASCDFISISSYGASTKSSGVVRLLKDLDNPVSGKHILIIEDIIDSGLTLSYLKDNISRRGALSVKTCTLLDKPSRRKVSLSPDYFGFEIPDEFVVGYGLDYGEKYRNLPDVCILKKEIYTA